MAGGEAAILEDKMQGKYEVGRATRTEEVWVCDDWDVTIIITAKPELFSSPGNKLYNNYIEEIIKCHISCIVW